MAPDLLGLPHRGALFCTIRLMDRFGLFVDAGYLLTEAGKLCTGDGKRSSITCKYDGLHASLVTTAEGRCGLSHLRTYWYDGALGAIPTPTTDHLSIAALENLKLRLGRVVAGRQKGVDSMLTRDLMTLARERAISVAFVVGGDEDLREGVIAAQDLGVQVVLLGVAATKSNQSFTLINECDGHLVLGRDQLAAYFKPASTDAPSVAADTALQANLPPNSQPEEVASSIARTAAENWARGVDTQLLRLVAARFPGLPKDIDAPLLRLVEQTMGSLDSREDIRRTARHAFAKRVNEILSETRGQ